MRKPEQAHQRDLEIHKAKQRLMPYFARTKSLTEMVDDQGNSSDIKDVDVFIANISQKRFDF